MRDKVTIAYRGAKYELGRGPTFFGIWPAGASRSQPMQWWPDSTEGWSAAWTRFTGLEAPGTIVPVGRRTAPASQVVAPASQGAARAGEDSLTAGRSDFTASQGGFTAGQGDFTAGQSGFAVGQGAVLAGPRIPGASARGFIAAALLAAGVVLGVIGLFPGYLGGASLAQQPAQLVPHVMYLAAWTASAVLIALGGTRLRLGALLGAGLSLITFGLFFADAGTVMAGGLHLAGAGLWLAIVGWVACAAGSAMAMLLPPARRPGVLAEPGRSSSPLGMPRGSQVGAALLLVLAGLGAAIAFAPSWDSFTLRTATGLSQYLTAGNAFANPGPVIAGDVAVMVALAVVVIAAAMWRPTRHGAVLVAGAAIPMVAQGVSALIEASEAATPAQFGFTPAEAERLGLTISSGLTPAFWIYGAFVLTLVVSCAWMLLTPRDFTAVSAGPYAGAPPDDDPRRAAQPEPDEDIWTAAAEPDDVAWPGAQTEPSDGTWHVPPADAFDMAGAQPPAPDADDIESVTEPGAGTPADARAESATQRGLRSLQLPQLVRPDRSPGAARGPAGRAAQRHRAAAPAPGAGHAAGPRRRTGLLGHEAPWFESWLDHPRLADPFWAPLQCGAALEQITVPTLLIGGWHDLFLEQTLEQYRTLAARGVPTRLLIGPWTHLDTAMSGTALRESLAWLDRYAGTGKRRAGTGDAAPQGDTAAAGRPVPARAERSVRVWVGGHPETPRTSKIPQAPGRAGQWRDIAGWPPPGTEQQRWYLGPEGILSPRDPAAGQDAAPAGQDAAPARFRYDPADPTPSVGGAILAMNAGAKDNRAVERRPDVLVFSSEPLDQPVEIIGEVAAELSVTRDNPNADLFVRLCDVSPRGRSRNVCDGIVRLTEQDPLAGPVKGVADRRGAPVRPRAPAQAPGFRRRVPALRPQPGQRGGGPARRGSRTDPVRDRTRLRRHGERLGPAAARGWPHVTRSPPDVTQVALVRVAHPVLGDARVIERLAQGQGVEVADVGRQPPAELRGVPDVPVTRDHLLHAGHGRQPGEPGPVIAERVVRHGIKQRYLHVRAHIAGDQDAGIRQEHRAVARRVRVVDD